MKGISLWAIQAARVVLALLAVFWMISLLGSVLEIMDGRVAWWRVVLAICVTLLPAWGYTALTRKLQASRAKDADAQPDTASR